MIVNFDRWITIERPVDGKDPKYRSSKPTWVPHCFIWAERRDDLPGRTEFQREKMTQSANRVRFRLRYRTDITSAMRVREGGFVYQIIGGPAEIGRKEYLEIYCERYSADGAAA